MSDEPSPDVPETPPTVAGACVETWWRLIETFNPAKHQSTYLFADEQNVFMGHWYEGEAEPRLSYCGQGGDGDFPIWPKYWMPVPLAPADARQAFDAEMGRRQRARQKAEAAYLDRQNPEGISGDDTT